MAINVQEAGMGRQHDGKEFQAIEHRPRPYAVSGIRAAFVALGLAVTLWAPVSGQERSRTERPGCSGLTLSTAEPAPRLPRADYPVVTEVEANSPAAQASLRQGDTILAVNGRDARELPLLFNGAGGAKQQVRIRRQSQVQEVELTLGTLIVPLRTDGVADPVCRYFPAHRG